MSYWYGMRLRPFGIGCQPRGVIGHIEEPKGFQRHYWSLIEYDHKLSEEECFQYDLDLLDIPDETC